MNTDPLVELAKKELATLQAEVKGLKADADRLYQEARSASERAARINERITVLHCVIFHEPIPKKEDPAMGNTD